MGIIPSDLRIGGTWGPGLMLLPPHLIVVHFPGACGTFRVRLVAPKHFRLFANRRVILRLIDFKAISLKCYLCIVVIAAPSLDSSSGSLGIASAVWLRFLGCFFHLFFYCF